MCLAMVMGRRRVGRGEKGQEERRGEKGAGEGGNKRQDSDIEDDLSRHLRYTSRVMISS